MKNLKVKAPIDGQVGNLEAQIGQSISAGEHIGQIITADLKVQALIDEHYVERVVQELPADFTRDGENYKLEVTKVYPESEKTDSFVRISVSRQGVPKTFGRDKLIISIFSWGILSKLF